MANADAAVDNVVVAAVDAARATESVLRALALALLLLVVVVARATRARWLGRRRSRWSRAEKVEQHNAVVVVVVVAVDTAAAATATVLLYGSTWQRTARVHDTSVVQQERQRQLAGAHAAGRSTKRWRRRRRERRLLVLLVLSVAAAPVDRRHREQRFLGEETVGQKLHLGQLAAKEQVSRRFCDSRWSQVVTSPCSKKGTSFFCSTCLFALPPYPQQEHTRGPRGSRGIIGPAKVRVRRLA